MPHSSCWTTPGSILATTGLSAKLGFSQAPPSWTQVAIICRSFCSSCWVVPGRTQAGADPSLYFQEAPEPGYKIYSFRPCRSTTQPPPKTTWGRDHTHQVPETHCSKSYSVGWVPAHQQLFCCSHSFSLLSGGQSLLSKYQQKPRFNYSKSMHAAHTEDTPGRVRLYSSDQVVCATKHLLHKDTLPRPGDVALYLIHRNKHRETARMSWQRNMSQMSEQ